MGVPLSSPLDWLQPLNFIFVSVYFRISYNRNLYKLYIVPDILPTNMGAYGRSVQSVTTQGYSLHYLLFTNEGEILH